MPKKCFESGCKGVIRSVVAAQVQTSYFVVDMAFMGLILGVGVNFALRALNSPKLDWSLITVSASRNVSSEPAPLQLAGLKLNTQNFTNATS